MSLLRRAKGAHVRQTRQGNADSYRQAGRRQPIRPVFSLPHFPALHFAVLSVHPRDKRRANRLRIRCDILLQLQIIQQIEIRIHLVIIVQTLQIADRSARRFRNRSFLRMLVHPGVSGE